MLFHLQQHTYTYTYIHIRVRNQAGCFASHLSVNFTSSLEMTPRDDSCVLLLLKTSKFVFVFARVHHVSSHDLAIPSSES